MEKVMKKITTLATVWLILVLVLFPKECIDAGLRGVFLCLDTVIPSLFPFFVCSGIVTGLGLARPLGKIFSPFMKPVFGVSGKGALPFVMGILSGYPVGAKCVSDLYSRGECSKSECEKMLIFCNNSGPLFILGAVGVGMLESPQMGRYLYIIHILSAVLTGIIFRFYKTDEGGVMELPLAENKDLVKSIMDAFSGATESIISVCGYVILFCVVGNALPKIGISPIIHGILEITGGAEEILNMGTGLEIRLPILSGIIAFSGFSVILQVMGIIRKTNLSPRPYLAGKTVQGIVAFLLTYLAMKLFPLTKNTAGVVYTANPKSIWEMSLQITLFILILLVFIRKKAVDN